MVSVYIVWLEMSQNGVQLLFQNTQRRRVTHEALELLLVEKMFCPFVSQVPLDQLFANARGAVLAAIEFIGCLPAPFAHVVVAIVALTESGRAQEAVERPTHSNVDEGVRQQLLGRRGPHAYRAVECARR